MRSADEWFDAYGESHQNPTNKKIHWICIPLILISLVGVLWDLKLPVPVSGDFLSFPLTSWFNLGSLLLVGALVYYLLISFSLALGMTLVAGLSIAAVIGLQEAGSYLNLSLFTLSLIIFILAWIGQFVGHKLEGKKPSFFEDIQFLMIGPLWLLGFIYGRLGITY